MGFFDSKSTTTSNLSQTDSKQTSVEGDNFRSGTGSVTSAASGNAKSFSLNKLGNENYVVLEDLNAELAAQAISEISGRAGETLESGIQFAKTVLDDVFASNKVAQTEAFAALDDVKDFAQGVLDKQAKTSDERLSDFGTMAFFGMAILAALLIWRG